MKRFIIHTLLMITALMTTAGAYAQSVRAICEPYVIQGRKFSVTFRVTNVEGRLANSPELKNCRLIYGPAVSTMQSSQIIYGQMSSSFTIDYTYTYEALKAGRVTVPAVAVSDGSKTYRSKPVAFEVLPPDRSQQQQQSGGNRGTIQPSSNVQKVRPNDLIVTTTLSKSNVYEQEAVIATIKVYTKLPITNFRATTLPVFEGFLSEELTVNDEPRIEHFRGENYYSAVLKRCLLYPKKSGTLKINSGRYDVTVITYEEITQGYFVTQREVPHNITTTSNETSVNVLPLPSPRPEGFNGAVGVYKITTGLEPQQLRTNEPAQYTFRITGTGNLKNLSAPEFAMPAGVDTFNPESSADAKFNGSDNMTGSFTATYNFIPKNVGELTIPAWKFVYFDPVTRKYVTVELPEYKRTVMRGSAAQGTSPQADIAKMTDIEHITPVSTSDLIHNPQSVFGTPLYILVYIIVIVALIGAAIIYRRHINFRADVEGRRTARASRVAVKRLRLARQAMDAHRNDEFYTLLAKALWGYISDKLRIPASALTRDNIAEKLGAYGADPALTDKTISILDDCEMARFTPHTDKEVSALYQTASDVIYALENVKQPKAKAVDPYEIKS